MRIDVISIFPAMFDAIREYGITRRAIESRLLMLEVWDPRTYSRNRHRNVDDRPYGGGPGMVMRPEPLIEAIGAARAAQGSSGPVIYLSPQGRRMDQAGIQELAARPGLILLAGRYEGVDERVLEEEIDEEWSIGDYVLSGGELAAMVLIDAITRLLPGALGNERSTQLDSFASGLLEHAQYTRPEDLDGATVPEVLLSGDHERIRRWRLKQSLGRTWLRRPELLAQLKLDEEMRALLEEFRREHASVVRN